MLNFVNFIKILNLYIKHGSPLQKKTELLNHLFQSYLNEEMYSNYVLTQDIASKWCSGTLALKKDLVHFYLKKENLKKLEKDIQELLEHLVDISVFIDEVTIELLKDSGLSQDTKREYLSFFPMDRNENAEYIARLCLLSMTR